MSTYVSLVIKRVKWITAVTLGYSSIFLSFLFKNIPFCIDIAICVKIKNQKRMPRDPSQDSVLHAAPQLGVWTASILPPHRAERSGPVSSARCMQVFHQCFKSCWWGLWAGFFQAICGPFAARDNKSQRPWLTGRWAWRKNNTTFILKNCQKLRPWQDQCLACFPSQQAGLEFHV